MSCQAANASDNAGQMKSDVKPEARVEICDTTNAPPKRQGYVDVFRGLLIAHMALDHASLMFNA
jgi:hypothetical protein